MIDYDFKMQSFRMQHTLWINALKTVLCFQQEEYTDHETNAEIGVVPFAFIFSDTFGEFVLPNLMTLD